MEKRNQEKKKEKYRLNTYGPKRRPLDFFLTIKGGQRVVS